MQAGELQQLQTNAHDVIHEVQRGQFGLFRFYFIQYRTKGQVGLQTKLCRKLGSFWEHFKVPFWSFNLNFFKL